MIEVLTLIIAVGVSFWVGSNIGYKVGREYTPSIMNVTAEFDETSKTFLVYDMTDNKFILQTPEESLLPELLSKLYPDVKIVMSIRK